MASPQLLRENTGFTSSTLASTGSGSPPRTLILCFDGTSNTPAERGTNVGKLFYALEKHNDTQRCYYQPGIGTYVPPTKPLAGVTATVTKAVDAAVAWYLEEHIIGGYRFLMSNYRPGDKILLFGFSRGAYTCRALNAMLSRVGLLNKDNEEMIPFAYKNFIGSDDPEDKSGQTGRQRADEYRKGFSREIKVDFVGVWDTVASVGITGRTLPGALALGITKHFRQALALDERRSKFGPRGVHLEALPALEERLKGAAALAKDKAQDAANKVQGGVSQGVSAARATVQQANLPKVKTPSFSWIGLLTCGLWKPAAPKAAPVAAPVAPTPEVEKAPTPAEETPAKSTGGLFGRSEKKPSPKNGSLNPEEEEFIRDEDKFKEVWFVGSHSDVGGSERFTPGKPCLGNLSLFWMLRELRLLKIDIIFRDEAFSKEPELRVMVTKPDLADPLMQALVTGTMPKIEASDQGHFESALKALDEDAKSDVFDSLTPPWLILEVLPPNFSMDNFKLPNLGQGRRIERDPPKLHWTAAIRRKAREYKPYAELGLVPVFADDDNKVISKLWNSVQSIKS